MASIQTQPGRLPRVKWRDPDGTSRSRSCPNRRAADKLKREVEEAVALGRRWAPAASERIPQLATMITAYLADLCRTAAQGTIDSRRYQLGQWVEWCHRERRDTAAHLSRRLVQDYDAHRAGLGREVSSRGLAVSIIGGFWRWCIGHDDYGQHVGPVALPKMPSRIQRAVVAPLWSEVDAVCAEAAKLAEGKPLRAYLPRLTLIMRAFGVRVSQALAMRAEDVHLARGTVWIDSGKSDAEKAGRALPMPPWFAALVRSWAVASGPLVGRVVAPSQAAALVHRVWRAVRVDGEPVRPEVYVRRPDHAFRKAIRTELELARCRSMAIEYWQGRSTGVAGGYTDPRALDLVEVANAIPAPGCGPSVAPSNVVPMPERPAKRARGRS
jgi:integrase